MEDKRRVFITSDWHLGGRADETDGNGKIVTPGSQICRSIDKLTEFIDWVRSQTIPGCITELVLNGDIVDFLAPDEGYEPQRWLGDEDLAVKRFGEIADRAIGPDGRGPFGALRDLLAAGCELTILLGNHDIEWSLPAVRSALIERIGATGRRFNFIYDGEACVRGKMLIEHGNRYDPINVVNHSALRQERSHLSRGLKCMEEERDELFFLPPLGSELVTQVFNRLLPQVPFLNLLKPEKEAVIPLVLAICPESVKYLNEEINIFDLQKSIVVNQLRRPAQPSNAGQLSTLSSEKYRSLDDLLINSLCDDSKWFMSEVQNHGNLMFSGTIRESLVQLSRKWEALFQKITFMTDLGQIFLAKTDTKKLQQLRIALRKVNDNATFDLTKESDNYIKSAQELIDVGGFTAIVFGHTHLAKRIELEGATYFNCGTWADTLRLPKEVMDDDMAKSDDAILSFINSMIKKDIEPYLFRCLSYVDASIDQNGSVMAELCQYHGKERPNEPVTRYK